jgi:hypothetical protein
MAALSLNPNNTFDNVNRVRCFNHTINLAVKALLHPFQPLVRRDGTTASLEIDDFDLPDLVDASEDEEEGNTEEDEEDEDIPMTEEEREAAFQEMDSVKTCLSKVS